jgi:tripartite-type tricarboxylate transporter receptor subunit TctC
VRLIVPGAPDSPIDLFARALAAAADIADGRPCLVENRSAERGGRAVATVEHAPADGRTLLMFGSGLVGGRHARDPLPADPFNRLSVIAQLAQEPMVLAVSSEGPASLEALVEGARGFDPARQAIGGADALSCLVGQEMLRLCDVAAKPKLYPSVAHMIYEIEAGRILGGWLRPALLPAGRRRLRLIATSGSQRSRIFPDLPTAGEQGARGLDICCWTGLFGPAGLPMTQIDATYRILEEAVEDWRVRSTVAALGMELRLRPGAALFETMLAHEALWAAAGPVGEPPRPPREARQPG